MPPDYSLISWTQAVLETLSKGRPETAGAGMPEYGVAVSSRLPGTFG
ncbi:MAG: hypothetical protein LBP22_17225 [Deltaproteobacteria bacterium]|nr:hypothetical protein [Deltaproteobacteria bacterium]